MDERLCGKHGHCVSKEETLDDRGYICVCDEGWKGVNCNEGKL